ncbi:MAG: hypothetical protein B6I22_12175 [Desulfobacteraceae bacterium 4572_123]|nr:MAG: hypothetical protein B6I22_12175 [Desulfobacteraceae bacterium 4572_123]
MKKTRKNSKIEHRKPEILENYYQVIIKEGIEGASIAKIARRMNIHPSLIIHYFKTKHNLTVELFDLLIERYAAPEFFQHDRIKDPHQRFKTLMDILFSFEYSRTVDPGVHFGFYYLSFRNKEINKRFREMINQLKVLLVKEFEKFKKEGIITVKDTGQAANMVVTLIEGLEFQTAFLDQNKKFEDFAEQSKRLAIAFLTGAI